MNKARTWDAAAARLRIQAFEQLPGALLPMLHGLQEEFGFIHDEAVPLIADALNISQAEVYGVISFYHDFRKTAPGRHVLQVCRAESCQANGCDALIRHLQDRLGARLGETTENCEFTLQQVFCLGNCALSPAILLDGDPYGRVSAEVIDFLIDDARRRM